MQPCCSKISMLKIRSPISTDGSMIVKTAQKLREQLFHDASSMPQPQRKVTVASSAVAVTDEMLATLKNVYQLVIPRRLSNLTDEAGKQIAKWWASGRSASGPSCFKGYMNNPEKTAEALSSNLKVFQPTMGDVGNCDGWRPSSMVAWYLPNQI